MTHRDYPLDDRLSTHFSPTFADDDRMLLLSEDNEDLGIDSDEDEPILHGGDGDGEDGGEEGDEGKVNGLSLK